MRILFYSDNFYPETSGISDSIISTARGLKALGHAVGFVVPKYSDKEYAAVGKTREELLLAEGFKMFRIPSLPFAGSASGQARNVIPLGWSISFAQDFNPDVIHSQTPFGTGIEALYASRVLGVPLVGTNHTLIHEFIKVYGPIKTKWAESAMQRYFSWYYNRCRFVSVVSQELLDDMRAHGFKRPAEVIPNPLSLETFSPASEGEKSDLRKKLDLSGPTVLFAGRVASEKRVDVVLRAFAVVAERLLGSRLVIAGNGPAEADMKKLANELKLGDKVIFTGFLDHATLSKWYKAADAFAMMCPIETQCIALMQALASGIPAVGVARGAVDVHIQPEWGIKVKEGDHAALAIALESVLKDPERAEMGRRARAYVQRFSQDVIAEQWLKSYRSVAALKKPKVSVVVPAHNEEESLAATLRAVLDQDYKDFEVIVVDNASTDKTQEIAREFPVKTVREEKKGLLHARERGRIEASGDIIVQMDADCLPDSGWLSRGAAHFENPRIVAVAGPYHYHDGGFLFRNVSLLSQKYLYKGASVIVQALGTGAVLIGGNAFIRADVLKRAGGYDTSIVFYGEDTDTAKKVSKFGRVLFDPKLVQKTSARRFKSEGTLKIAGLYLFHFFRVIYRNRK